MKNCAINKLWKLIFIEKSREQGFPELKFKLN